MLNRKGIEPSLLKEEDSLSYSYPINRQYHRSVSFSCSHVGMMLAYSSANLVIILVGGKYVKAILKWHKCDICTLCFENNGPHLISSDIEGNVVFWHYQDSVWKITRKLVLLPRATSFSWCAARALICFSSKKGLFVGNVSDFETKSKRLANDSKFCQFYNDGSLIASHSYKKILQIFSLINQEFVPQVFKFSSDIVVFEFHPIEVMFMVITNDGKLRVYVRDEQMIFSCSTILSVPIPGRFVRPPALYKFKGKHARTYEIVFVSKEGKKIKIEIDNKGKLLDQKPNKSFITLPPQLGIKENGLRAAFMTNHGIEVVTVKNNGISVHSDTKYTTLFHRSRVVLSSFAPMSDNFFTLDEEKKLIFWPLLNPYETSKIISRKADAAAWLGNRNILVLQNDTLVSIDVLNTAEYNFQFPKLTDCVSLFIKEKDVYAVCKTKVVTSKREYEIGEFEQYSYSASFNEDFLFLTTDKEDQISAYVLPSFTRIPVDKREGKIKSIGCLSLSSFAVLSGSFVEVWGFINNMFKVTYKFEFAPMNGMVCDSTCLGGRIFTFDSKRVYLLENGIIPFIEQSDVSGVAVSYTGSFVAISSHAMEMFPVWTSKSVEVPAEKGSELDFINRKDVYLNVDRMTEDSRFLLSICDIVKHNFVPSPSVIANPTDSIRRVIDMTFVYLLEYSLIKHLDDIQPVQVPAIPAQYAQSCGLQLDAHASEEIQKINLITKSISQDVDLFGLRYLTAIKSSSWPPAFIGLWLSFSISQSQIALALKEKITVSSLTKHFVAIGIHSQDLLEDLVKAALTQTWAETKKVDSVALLYIAMSNISKIIKLYEIVGDSPRAEFFRKNFKMEKNRKSALKNAYSSLSKQNFIMSAALFLVAGDLKSAVQITYEKLKDPILAFLIIRLVEKSVTGEMMNWFLSTVQWNDKVIPIIIANLAKKEDVPAMIEPLLLDEQSSSNKSSMGDRRIALYQIYHRLTNDTKLLPRIANNMINDGLVPLANYIYKLPRTHQLVQSSISTEFLATNNSQENSEEEKTEKSEEDDYKGDFDFGGGGSTWSDDDDSWSSSESEKEEEEEDEKEENNKEESRKEAQNETKAEVNNEFEVFSRFLLYQIEQFSRYHATNVTGDSNEIAKYALHYGYRETAYSLFDEEGRNFYMKQLSKFIDYCGSMYMESARIPATNRMILNLCEELAKRLSDDPFSFDYNTIMNLPNTGYSHSVLYGAFAAAAWSFEPQFVDQLLTPIVPKDFNEKTIRNTCSLLDTDISSPRFPDTVPQLVMAFSSTYFYDSTDIECARFVVMFLVLRRLISISNSFKPHGRWHRHILDKFKLLEKTLEMYQIAQSVPAIIQPKWTGKEPRNTPLLELIKNEYKNASNFFSESHNGAFKHLPSTSIFRRDSLMISKALFIPSPLDKITACCLNPRDKNQCALACGSQIVVMNFSNLSRIKQLQSSAPSSDINQIIAHPELHLFLAVSSNRIRLFSFNGQCPDHKFELPQNEKIISASISPSGSRIAICTDQTLFVFLFDFSDEESRPCFTRRLDSKPTSVAWVSYDNVVAVAFNQNIRIIDTLSEATSSITMKKEWGSISAMRFNLSHYILVVGTKKGFAVVLDSSANFEVLCVINCNEPIVSISHYEDVFAIAAERGQVSIFSTTKLSKLESNIISWNVRSVAVSNDFIVAVGDCKSVAMWHAI